MPSLQYETTSDLPASPETTAAVGNGANDLERTAVELMKARNGEETHLTSIINIVRAAPLTSNPTTASTQESKKLKEFKIFPKLPLETRQYIFRLANDIPGYLEVQIDIAESNDCLKAYGPHDCQENHGENTSFAVITFTTPTSPHPLFSVCKDSRNELIRTTKGVLPAVSGAKILFDPVHTTIYINVMGNFLSVIDYLGGWAFCCKKFCYRFQAIQKLAIDWRCCIHPSTFQDDPCRSDGCDDDDENDYAETCDDFDSTTGPREGVWGGIFKAAFFDLKALEYVLFSRNDYDGPDKGDMTGFKRERSSRLLRRDTWPERMKMEARQLKMMIPRRNLNPFPRLPPTLAISDPWNLSQSVVKFITEFPNHIGHFGDDLPVLFSFSLRAQSCIAIGFILSAGAGLALIFIFTLILGISLSIWRWTRENCKETSY